MAEAAENRLTTKAVSTQELDELHLPIYSEHRGYFKGLETDSVFVHALIDDKELVCPRDSVEGKIVAKALKDVPIGSLVAILRTDITSKPLMVRILDTDARPPCRAFEEGTAHE